MVLSQKLNFGAKVYQSVANYVFIRLNKVKCKKFVDRNINFMTLCPAKNAENSLILVIAKR